MDEASSLAEHDLRYHPEGIHDGTKCLLRDYLEADRISPSETVPINLGFIPTIELEMVRRSYEASREAMDRWWLKAPNGANSRLKLDDWLAVRTPSFKERYGDWEKHADLSRMLKFIRDSDPVVEISGKDFGPDGVKLTDKVPRYFNEKHGGVAVNPELGPVQLDLEGVQDDMGHGMGRIKASAFAAVHDVVEKGLVFNRSTNWKGRNWATAVIGAPIIMNGERCVCEVVVKTLERRRGFYLHEVDSQNRVDEAIRQASDGKIFSRLVLCSIACEVAKDKLGVMLDENGEPVLS